MFLSHRSLTICSYFGLRTGLYGPEQKYANDNCFSHWLLQVLDHELGLDSNIFCIYLNVLYSIRILYIFQLLCYESVESAKSDV